jgi:hypothetical protein
VRVVLYSKPGCHLCDIARLDLLDLEAEFKFDLIERNILEDEALHDAYFLMIPVVEISLASPAIRQPLLLSAPINQPELRRQIKAMAAQEQNNQV